MRMNHTCHTWHGGRILQGDPGQSQKGAADVSTMAIPHLHILPCACDCGRACAGEKATWINRGLIISGLMSPLFRNVGIHWGQDRLTDRSEVTSWRSGWKIRWAVAPLG